MKNTTLCLLVKNDEIILARKKQKLGKGKYNGYGGHIEKGENEVFAAMRELREESGGVSAEVLQKVAELTYVFKDPKMKEWDEIVHVYLVSEWEGVPKETSEMGPPKKFKINKIPFDQMWENDRYWMHTVLTGEKIKATIHHDVDEMHSYEPEYVDHF